MGCLGNSVDGLVGVEMVKRFPGVALGLMPQRRSRAREVGERRVSAWSLRDNDSLGCFLPFIPKARRLHLDIKFCSMSASRLDWIAQRSSLPSTMQYVLSPPPRNDAPHSVLHILILVFEWTEVIFIMNPNLSSSKP